MKICFLYQSDYPWDVRVEKLVQSIRAQDHQVFLVCRNMTRRVLNEVADGITIRRLPYFSAMPAMINKMITIPFYFNLLWLFYGSLS